MSDQAKRQRMRKIDTCKQNMFAEAAKISKECRGAKFTIIISDLGYNYGFLGHDTDDWPELHQLVSTHCNKVATTDDYVTVAERNAESLSIASTTYPSIAADQTGHGLLSRVATLEEQVNTIEATLGLSKPHDARNSSPVSEQSDAHPQGRPSACISETRRGTLETTLPTATADDMCTSNSVRLIHARSARATSCSSRTTPNALHYSSEQAMPMVLSTMDGMVNKRGTRRYRQILPKGTH